MDYPELKRIKREFTIKRGKLWESKLESAARLDYLQLEQAYHGKMFAAINNLIEGPVQVGGKMAAKIAAAAAAVAPPSPLPPVPPKPPGGKAYYGKGKGKGYAPSDSDESDDEGAKKAKKSTEEKNKEALRKLLDQIARMVDLFNDPVSSMVVVSKEAYEQALQKMEPNLAIVRKLSTKQLASRPKLRKLKEHVFAPRDMQLRMPVETLKQSKKRVDCRACCGAIEATFVSCLRCTSSKFHVACAAVLIDAVEPAHFYDCMACMNFFRDGKRVEKNQCRHREWKDSNVEQERKDALAIFTAKDA